MNIFITSCFGCSRIYKYCSGPRATHTLIAQSHHHHHNPYNTILPSSFHFHQRFLQTADDYTAHRESVEIFFLHSIHDFPHFHIHFLFICFESLFPNHHHHPWSNGERERKSRWISHALHTLFSFTLERPCSSHRPATTTRTSHPMHELTNTILDSCCLVKIVSFLFMKSKCEREGETENGRECRENEIVV